MARRHAVLAAQDGKPETRTPAVRGGKGAGLACLTDLGLPVPPSFTLDTGVCRAFMQHRRIPNRIHGQIRREIARLERITGYTFGDPLNPLLVSVRSGAEVSMPGMMDTILNVGIDPFNLEGLTRRGGKRFARDTRARFEEQWKTIQPNTSRHDIPSDPYDQLELAMTAVWESWDSPRAQAYRQHHKIPQHLGTAVTVQAMVFGNIDQESCTGVVFSADVTTGMPGLYGEFLVRAQGEDVVSGTQTPQPIGEMAAWNSQAHQQLTDIVSRLATHYGDIVDVEFTVEKGELFILQVRKAKRSPLATVVHAVHDVWEGRCTKDEALQRVSSSQIASLKQPHLETEGAVTIARGLAASPGAAVGVIARTSEQAQQYATLGVRPILVRADTSPEDLPGMMVSKAIVTAKGGKTSHAAVVARELGLPAVVGADLNLADFPEGELVSVDGQEGVVYEGELPLQEPELPKEVNLFLKWLNARVDPPRIAFEAYGQRFSANEFLSDFYLTDVMARLSQGTPLEREAEALKAKTHRQIAEKFALYLLMATSGESRHFHRETSDAECDRTTAALDAMLRLDQIISSHNYGSGEEGRLRMHRDVVKALKGRTLKFVTKHVGDLVTVFQQAHWRVSSYGGPKWAAIAEALHDFLTGKLTVTLFVDHVFDLRHNGGKLFNKNSLFRAETDERNILEQLNIKKMNLTPAELYQRLGCYADPSDEVLTLWGVGKARKMW